MMLEQNLMEDDGDNFVDVFWENEFSDFARYDVASSYDVIGDTHLSDGLETIGNQKNLQSQYSGSCPFWCFGT